MCPKHRSTPPGQHRPVLLEEVLACLDPHPGQVAVDCTVGWAGHSVELAKRLGPQGKLIGIDSDGENLPRARERLEATGCPYSLHHGNFAGLATILAKENLSGVDMVLADLGMSSMQVDDPERGFSYARDGQLDMRLDRSRGQTAAQLLASISETELSKALRELGDEPQAERIAAAIVSNRKHQPILRTGGLVGIIMEATGNRTWQLHPGPKKWNIHPAARTFQALRILVNREIGNLGNLLRILPDSLVSGGRVAIISFHSGEDRLVKSLFRNGLQKGTYAKISDTTVRATFRERTANPRARSAKLRWAVLK